MSNQSNDLPEGFKITELGSLPEEWEVVQMDEAIKLSRGISWNKSDESADGIPVVAIPNVKEGRVNFDFHYKISKNISDEKTLRAGDILLVGSSGSIHNVGKAALVPEIPFPKLTFASFLVKATPSAEKYLVCWLSPRKTGVVKNYLSLFLCGDKPPHYQWYKRVIGTIEPFHYLFT